MVGSTRGCCELAARFTSVRPERSEAESKDLLGGFLRKRQGGFVRLPAPELLLLCLSKVEVTKRKRHPDGAPFGHPALRVRGRVTGFFDGTSMYRRKTGRLPAGHPADFPPPARRAIGAPGKAARSRRALGRSHCAAAKAPRGVLLIRIGEGFAERVVTELTLELSGGGAVRLERMVRAHLVHLNFGR